MFNYQMIYQCFTVFLELEETPVLCNDFSPNHITGCHICEGKPWIYWECRYFLYLDHSRNLQNLSRGDSRNKQCCGSGSVCFGASVRDPDPSIIKKNNTKNLRSYCFLTSLWLFIFEKWINKYKKVLRVTDEIAGSGSVIQRCGSGYVKNATDPQR